MRVWPVKPTHCLQTHSVGPCGERVHSREVVPTHERTFRILLRIRPQESRLIEGDAPPLDSPHGSCKMERPESNG